MDPIFFAASILILLISVILHEVAHGFVALKFGDHTAERMGRLTLNPLPHIDPMGTVVIPILLILSGLPVLGMAKPVPVNPLNFSNLRRGELLVSAAGIGTNFTLALLAAVLFHILSTIPGVPFLLLELLRFTITINLYLGIFNLLPIPPLDGSKMLESQLSYKFVKVYQQLAQYGFYILIALIFIPFFISIPSPLFILLHFLVDLFGNLLGIPNL